MAFAAAIPMIESGIAAAPEILNAAAMAAELAQKYGPKVKGAVNFLMHSGRKKKSAMAYLKNLGTKQGLEKFIKKDLGKGLRKTGSFIEGAGEFATDVAHFTNEGQSGGVLGEHAHKIGSLVGGAAKEAGRYHHLAEQYHDQGQALISPLMNANGTRIPPAQSSNQSTIAIPSRNSGI